MANKSLGSSLAHGLSKRDIRESQSRVDKFVATVDFDRSDGKQSKTAQFNGLVKNYKTGVKEDILLEYSHGKTKKKIVTLFILEGCDGGFLLTVVNFYKANLYIDYMNPLWFTKHCVARLYQTFSVRSMKEFSLKHLDIFINLAFVGISIAVQHKNKPNPESHTKELSLWHPKAEFRTVVCGGYLSVETVISAEAMSPIKAKKGLKQAMQDGRSLDLSFEAFLAKLNDQYVGLRSKLYK